MSKVVKMSPIRTKNFVEKFNKFAEKETKGLPTRAKVLAKVLMLHQAIVADIRFETKTSNVEF